MKNFWKKCRYHLEVLGIRLLIACVPKWSRSGVFRMAKIFGSIFHAVDRRGRRVSHANLEACRFPVSQIQSNRHIVQESYQNFLTSALDLAWSKHHMTQENYQQFCEFQDAANVPALTQTGRPIIFVTYHFGNFEFASYFMAFHGPGSVVVQQETKNPAIGEILTQLRTVGLNRPLPRTGVMIRLLKNLKSGGSIGLLADLTVPPGKLSAVVDFFGLKMCVTKIHVELARRTGAPIVPIVARPRPDHTYLVETRAPIEVKPDDDPDAVAQQCIDCLQQWVREEPRLWLWSYKHFRYLEPGREDDYPFYANPKKSFTKMLTARKNPAGE